MEDSLFDLNQMRQAIVALHAKALRVESLLAENDAELQKIHKISEGMLERNKELSVLVPELMVFGKTKEHLDDMRKEIDARISKMCKSLKEFRPVSPALPNLSEQGFHGPNLSALSKPWSVDSARVEAPKVEVLQVDTRTPSQIQILNELMRPDTMSRAMKPDLMTHFTSAFSSGGVLSLVPSTQPQKSSWADVAKF